MKKILLISALLAFALAVQSANALTVQNISVTETGGIITEGSASVSGTSDAETSVQSVIKSGGENTSVHIEVGAKADDWSYATSVDKVIKSKGTTDVRIGTWPKQEELEDEEAEGLGTKTASDPVGLEVFAQISAFFTHIFSFFFFW